MREMVAVIGGFRAKSVFILLACGVRISTWTFKPAQAAECRRAIVYRSSLRPVPQQFHDDLALLILLAMSSAVCPAVFLAFMSSPCRKSLLIKNTLPTRQAKWRTVFPSSLACIIGKRLSE